MKAFASDNFSGAHPDILAALSRANTGHTHSYGADPHTEEAVRVLRAHLGPEAEVFFVFNGTAANVLCLKAMVPSYGAVVCARTAHINVDECGAPEGNVGCKLIALDSRDGKLRPEQIPPLLVHKGNEHHAQPWAVSVSQTTELGTLYSLSELRALVACAHDHGLLVHLDGSRIANAVAALGCTLAELVVESGVDALSLGGTKNGLLLGEAVVFLRSGLAAGFPFIRKQSMQLFSKMRFMGAQFAAYFENDLWLRNARHANAMAALLERELASVSGWELALPREANAIFARLPKEVIPRLQEAGFFYVWDEEAGVVRWMTSWDTEPEDVRLFALRVREALQPGS